MSDHQTSLPRLRTAVAAETDGNGGGAANGAGNSVDLVVDLIAATKLVPADKLALAAERARQTGSLPRALVDEGLASGLAVARRLAAQYQLPLIDFMTTTVDEHAA